LAGLALLAPRLSRDAFFPDGDGAGDSAGERAGDGTGDNALNGANGGGGGVCVVAGCDAQCVDGCADP